MQIHSTITGIRAALIEHHRHGRKIGFVATMGALHAGHTSLIERARAENDVVIVSIFVNPLQFTASEDLETYPRPFAADSAVAEAAKVDDLFAPSVEEMYPDGPVATKVSVPSLAERWEGARRPGHFDGMATVVTKLFSILGPCTAYFGDKDWQQLAIVRRLVVDLSLPVDVVACPTIRERDGLALSSRNVHLSADERLAALSLSHALAAGIAAIQAGMRSPDDVHDVMFEVLAANPLVRPSYVAVVNSSLAVPEVIAGSPRLLVAADIGGVHLIDNVGMSAPLPTNP